ncbi:MAG: 23S rRNA (uridine(2552)-2'-O)-methyltransferase RlmE [Gammaproteobacteria bacterium]|nr:23S rRNA (uridine(2552)-2'-O)-methyltransferase RlmE [Gammaproteobacteria bacterium]MCW8840655.1 23S rRNA (uridine(2552)-2'-O)-methyltransferase RlmE [Gammaproteobacteria bacterium]MCW8927435.1 23S rRNA (uridine(2552)-2'-O)-methyltransferase RlmE [Gammaproteobacteria bacterium]MCW8958480.1 23S rRNA (uridine(2552)-2'-O)-methyltransferase RlmE [Gammaproteobacteria bacterium]MCW8973498.1 23S rRNA (uridine(2552)-2'-O)-methyltransferase RlmE [Gammaproteobacteria bacterium]
MARSKSSSRWLKEHFDDEYVTRAQQEGYRSRASYKLLEIDGKDKLLKPGMVVVDLGAAPGGWTQIAADRVGDKGVVVALDILPMDPVPGAEVLQGDFREDEVLQRLLDTLGEHPVDLVMSDMAPNISGMKTVDQPRAMYLVELTLELAKTVLKPGGDMLVKLFQGEGSDEFIKACRTHFRKVIIRKPAASRPRSREVYVLARNYFV